MKRYFYFFLSCLLATVFFACSSDSDEDNSPIVSPDIPVYVLTVDDNYTYTKINDYSSGSFKMAEYRVVYSTTDYNGEKVRVSMYLSVPENPKRAIIDCHATISANTQAPSNSRPAFLLDAIAPMVNAVCIAPDYIGYGESVSHIHAFADPLLHGRTVRDAVKVAYDMITNKLNKSLPEAFPSFILGVSQGGGVAIATQRAIEEDNGLADFIQLRGTYASSSALDFAGITRVWTTEWTENAFPSGLILGILSMVGENKASEDILAEILTKEFLETGIVELIKKKELTSDQLIEYSVAALAQIYKDTAYPIPNSRIFTPAMMDKTSTTYQKVMEYMTMGNAWQNWTPQHTICFTHAKEDNIVPFSQSEELKTYFDSIKFSNYSFSVIPISSDVSAAAIHNKACTLGYTLAIQSIITQ